MSAAINITGESEFQERVLRSDVPVLVDFWADWCMPCRLMSPVLEEIAKEYSGLLTVAKVNTEDPENRNLAFQYEIQSIPNMKLFKKGIVVKDFVGLRPKNVFSKEIQENLNS